MRFALLSIILVIALTASGCWNQVELEEWALVSAIGLDIIPGEDEDLVEMTVQLIKTRHIGTPEQGGAKGSAFWTVSATGRTTPEAASNLEKQIGRRLFLQSARIIVIGEDLARSGIDVVLDWFFREENVRRKTWLLVARNHTAKETLCAPHELDIIPANAIETMMQNGQHTAGIIDSTLHRYFRARFTTTSHPMLVGVEMTTPTSADSTCPFLTISDIAIFKEDHLIDWLTHEDSRGVLWLFDTSQKGPLLVKCEDMPGYATIEVLRYKRTIDMDISESGEIRSIIYNVKLTSRLIAQTCAIDYSNTENLSKLENYTKDFILKDIEIALKTIQQLNSDVIFLGREIERYYPKIWYQELAANWSEIFPEIPIESRVQIDIQRIGMAFKPTNYHREE